MKKHQLASYLIFLLPQTIFYALFTIYEIYRYGLFQGLYLALLLWSFYILCVPAAHGRIIIGIPAQWATGKVFFPEPYFWATAVGLNIITIFFAPWMYHKTVFTQLLQHILTNPDYWIILLIAAAGTWYRFLFGGLNYIAYPRTHTVIRHLILLIGLFLLFWLTHQELIIMLNMTATG